MIGLGMIVVGAMFILLRDRFVAMNRPAYEFWNLKMSEKAQRRMAVFVGVVWICIGIAECSGVGVV